MSILTANLKHLYQRRGMWLIYLLFVPMAFTFLKGPLLEEKPDRGDFVGFAVLPFFIGFILTLPQMDVFSKPMSYCLPGHRRMFRRYVFGTGIAISVLCSLLFLSHPDLSGWPLLFVLCSSFFAGLACYVVGAAAATAGLKGAGACVWGP
ncbi:MAG: hypothetical protein ACYS8Z_26640, partial [Planctomycetota bacterium]